MSARACSRKCVTAEYTRSGASEARQFARDERRFRTTTPRHKMGVVTVILVLAIGTKSLADISVAQQAAASLTSVAPSFSTPAPLQRLQNFYDISRQQNRRVNLAAAQSVSQPHVYDYAPTYSSSASYISRPPSYFSHSSRPVSHSPFTKPYFLKRPSYYPSQAHSDFFHFPISSHKHQQSSSTSLYSYMMPLALLGISIPALGLMYTYFSRRRRRDLQSTAHLPLENLEYYMELLDNSLQRFQEELDD